MQTPTTEEMGMQKNLETQTTTTEEMVIECITQSERLRDVRKLDIW